MIEFKLPSLGADMDEGTLLEWRVKPGDRLKRGQVVAIVDTTKAAIDVECWDEGTVDELIVAPGTTVPVNTVLALLRAPGETAEDSARWKAQHPGPQLAPQATVPVAAAAVAGPIGAVAATAGRQRVSPAARRLAQQMGVDLNELTGSGPQGAIVLEDVQRAAGKGVPPERKPIVGAAAAGVERANEMRRTIAAAMARSKREIPHYYLATDVPLGAASRWLGERNAALPVTERLLMAVLLIKAVAKALLRFPEFNGFVRDGQFVSSSEVHVGVAISLRQGGLIAPAILHTDRLPLDQLMRELGDLVRRARAFTLRSTELSMPTVTVTNLGEQGADTVFGIIYPPQVALVGFGSVRERPWVENGQMTLLPAVTATLAADHRASDGHRGSLFLAEVSALLQQPQTL